MSYTPILPNYVASSSSADFQQPTPQTQASKRFISLSQAGQMNSQQNPRPLRCFERDGRLMLSINLRAVEQIRQSFETHESKQVKRSFEESSDDTQAIPSTDSSDSLSSLATGVNIDQRASQEALKRVRFCDELSPPQPLCRSSSLTISEASEDLNTPYHESLENFLDIPSPEATPWLRLEQMCTKISDDTDARMQANMLAYQTEESETTSYRAFIDMGNICLDVKVEDYVMDGEESLSYFTDTFAPSLISDSGRVKSRYIKVWICNDDAESGYNQPESKALLIIRVQEDGISELVALKAKTPLSGNQAYAIADKFKDFILPRRYYLHDDSKRAMRSPYSKGKYNLPLRSSLPMAQEGLTWYGKKGMSAESFAFREIKCRSELVSQDSHIYTQAINHLRSSSVSFVDGLLEKFVRSGKLSKRMENLFSLQPLCERHGIDFSTATIEELAQTLYRDLRSGTNSTANEKDFSQFFTNYFSEIHRIIFDKLDNQEGESEFTFTLTDDERMYYLALDVVHNTFIFVEESQEELASKARKPSPSGVASPALRDSPFSLPSALDFVSTVGELERKAFSEMNYNSSSDLPTFSMGRSDNRKRSMMFRKRLESMRVRVMGSSKKPGKKKSSSARKSNQAKACNSAELLALKVFTNSASIVSDDVDRWDKA
ncbi:MAG: hypothetical protein L7U87_08605 [Chlamydiales bacterium]|nr:hypothetical protein [Chlamydiales bacterium]